MLKLAIGMLAAAVCAWPGAASAGGSPQDRRAENAPVTDETVAVQKGTRLNVNLFAGEIAVGVWGRDAVRVQSEHSSRERVDVRATDAQVSVRARSTMGPPGSQDLKITVPAWMRLDLSGTYTDVTVDGVQGQINVDTVRGDIRVKGGAEFVTLKSVEGTVTLENAKGRINIRSVNEDVKLIDVAGDVTAETVNGSLTMERMQADSVDAATVNGPVVFEGAIRSNGQYRITSHNGDVAMTVPDNTSATVSVRTYNGSFSPNFQVPSDDASRRNRRYNFTLGGGSARIVLESFGGTIRMTKGGGRR
jgi:putative adhesin